MTIEEKYNNLLPLENRDAWIDQINIFRKEGLSHLKIIDSLEYTNNKLEFVEDTRRRFNYWKSVCYNCLDRNDLKMPDEPLDPEEVESRYLDSVKDIKNMTSKELIENCIELNGMSDLDKKIYDDDVLKAEIIDDYLERIKKKRELIYSRKIQNQKATEKLKNMLYENRGLLNIETTYNLYELFKNSDNVLGYYFYEYLENVLSPEMYYIIKVLVEEKRKK